MGRDYGYDVMARYLAPFGSEWGWVAAALLLCVLSAVSLLRPRWLRWLPPRLSYWLLFGVCAVAGVVWALKLGWLADDAFISFRYARNWAQGLGLVYNAGERVEGYTNFLWVALLTPFEMMGLHLGIPSIVLTLTCQVATLFLVALLVQRHSPPDNRPQFSIAAALLSLNYVFACFGTSGLETMMGAMWVLWALERAQRGAPLAAGLFGILATMTHPDHAIFYVVLGVWVLLPPKPSWRVRLKAAVRYSLPFFLLYVPYFAGRWLYYGDPFPNTYYAKNAGSTYFFQGGNYLALSGLSTGLWVALPPAAYGLWVHRKSVLARFVLVALPVFLLYVAKIGGDFMLGRLILPLLPPVFLLAELGLRALAQKNGRLRATATVAGLAFLCTAAVPSPIVKDSEKYLHLADERTFYPIASYQPLTMGNIYWRRSQMLNRELRELSRPVIMAMGSLGIIGYETSLPMVDNYGLVHRELAHWRPRRRGRPGHEKMMPPGLVVQSDADLSDLSVYPPPYGDLGRTQIHDLKLHVVRYEEPFFRELQKAGFRRPGLLGYIDRYSPPRGPDSQQRMFCDLWYMNQIYFRHNEPDARRRRLLSRLRASQPAQAELWQFLVDAPSAPPGFVEVARLDFDEPHPDWKLTGSAFTTSPKRRESVGQGTIANVNGGFLNSYQDEPGDRVQGTLTTQAFEIVGDVLTFQLAGGMHYDHTYAELLVDGEPWFRATGCNSGIAGRRAFRVDQLRGARAQLRLVDKASGAWGHIVLDEVVQWSVSHSRTPSAPDQRKQER